MSEDLTLEEHNTAYDSIGGQLLLYKLTGKHANSENVETATERRQVCPNEKKQKCEYLTQTRRIHRSELVRVRCCPRDFVASRRRRRP